jgi:hypothetical protein
MGLISGIVCAPVVAPARGLLFIFEKIKEAVDEEMYDETRLEGKLVGLSLQLDLGEISEAEYRAAEDGILERLSSVRAYKESLEPRPRRARARRAHR